MGLFDKKFCDVCGNKIGLLGNRKLEDGNLCKDCAAKLSPWFSDRRHSTLAEIKEQLAWREANQEAAAAFHTTKTVGASMKLYVDEPAGKFTVCASSDIAGRNPDILDLSQVTDVRLDVDETKTEELKDGPDGRKVSYEPKRYFTEKDYYVVIAVNCPWYDEIRFRLNSSSVQGSSIMENMKWENMGKDAVKALKKKPAPAAAPVSAAPAAAPAARGPMDCPFCGATTTPDANGCCEYCGSKIIG